MDLKVKFYKWASLVTMLAAMSACGPWFGESPDTLYGKAGHGAQLKAPEDLSLKQMSNFYNLPQVDSKAKPVSIKPPKGMRPKNDDFKTKITQ